ncbi:DNA polymerase III subunit alpha [Limosilactobacillus caecicola]|uniref:DNA polymerase III subunit alpha n=1 Tax=Limosilactobacillus caecicola TaxID=2941332 RepID=UPI0020400036|nr:DNA polymerase III subunit alpha [Limosilactobacillus caecicola]
MAVVPLETISTYSLLQSTIRPTELVQAAKERGYSAIALTDRDVLYGVVDFYNAARQAGIRPLIGVQLTIQVSKLAGQQVAITVFAKDQQGYEQLMKLSTQRMTTGADLSKQDLQDHLDHYAVVVRPTPSILQAQGFPEITAFLQWLGHQATAAYLGINLTLDTTARQVLQDLSQQVHLPLIADEQVEYLDANQYFPTQVLRAIGDGRQIESPLQVASTTGQHYLRNAPELQTAYQQAGLADAINNNEQLVRTSNFEIKFQKPQLPHFPVPTGKSTAEYLRELCVAGLRQRQLAPGTTVDQYWNRLNRELKVIHEMGFDDYFLIVWDIMAFAHRQHITTGPGRGSAAGSLVAYALAITDVDPLEYGLLFERFLNPERAQMPDIDLDIPDNRRQEVLDYVHQRYGHQRVAQIITFGTLAARQVIRDVGRVFGVPKYQIEAIVDIFRVLGRHRSVTLAAAIQESQPLRNLMTDDELTRLVVTVAQQLEGLPRHYSTHAAGVVLSARPLEEVVPLQAGNDEVGMDMTQFPKEIVESVGLLKMDFLGLRNLSIMDRTLQLIHQREPHFDVTKVSLEDQPTLELFRQGLTDGIFQFESSGIRQTLQKLVPNQFEDIVAVNALYRPGPMENIAHFIARKHGQEPINLPDDSLQPILGPTYGILVYQEQVMQVASTMAGFSLGQADLLRRAMSKKKAATMESMRSRFIDGAVANGYDRQVAQQVFDYIDQFANYGFNRSHAVAYSKMAYEMAYLKRHYTTEFFTALLSIEPNAAKQRRHFADAKRFGVTILPPDINNSHGDFILQNGKILMGLSMIKGMRQDFMKAIFEERQKGAFASLPDFVQRMDEKWQKAVLIEPLIYVGAFDHLGYNRAEMIDGLAGLFAGNEFTFQSKTLQPVMNRRPEYSLSFRLMKENEYLGVYLSGHPVSQYDQLRRQRQTQRVIDLKRHGQVQTLVMLNRIHRINTKKTHQPMAFATASDETGSIDVTIFPRQYQQYLDLIQPSKIVLIQGNVEYRNDHFQLIVNQVIPVDELVASHSSANIHQRWVIRLEDQQLASKQLQRLRELAADDHGHTPVVIFDVASQQARQLPVDRWLAGTTKVGETLNKIFGSDNVVLQAINK